MTSQKTSRKKSMMPEQLAFPFFIGEPEPVLPRPSRYRRRLARVAAIALELGQRQGKRRAIPQRLATAVVQAPVMAFHPSREDRELLILASRVARLTISRRDPESFFIERSEIAKPKDFCGKKAPAIAGARRGLDRAT
jgi:hypothetical protein